MAASNSFFVQHGFELAWLFPVALEMLDAWWLTESSAVQSGHIVTLADKRPNSMKPYKSSSPENEDMHGFPSSLPD